MTLVPLMAQAARTSDIHWMLGRIAEADFPAFSSREQVPLLPVPLRTCCSVFQPAGRGGCEQTDRTRRRHSVGRGWGAQGGRLPVIAADTLWAVPAAGPQAARGTVAHL